MAGEREALRDWHRLFGLLLTDFFSDSPFEGVAMPFTMEDFQRQFIKEHFPELSDEDQVEVLRKLPAAKRLAGLTPEQIREYLDQLSVAPRPPARKPRRKK